MASSTSVIDSYKKMIGDLDNQVRLLKAQLGHVTSESAATLSLLATEQAALKEAQKELAATKEELEAQKNDMDDLFMILSDHDMKVKRYRGRLRDLGQEVSDDEDEE